MRKINAAPGFQHQQLGGAVHGPTGLYIPADGLQSGPLTEITQHAPWSYYLMDQFGVNYGSTGDALDVDVNVSYRPSRPFKQVTKYDTSSQANSNRHTTLINTNPSSFTLGAWVKMSTFTDTLMITHGHGESPESFSSRQFVAGLLKGSGAAYRPWFQFYHSGTRTTIDTGASYEISDSNWHHVAFGRAASKYRIWLDGQLIGTSDAANATVNTGSDEFYTGTVGGGGSSFDMEQAHTFWENSLLTDANILEIAEAPSVGLASQYPTWP